MAMSNWDTLAFNDKGKPSVGRFENHIGNSVEIYKNFLYIHTPKMWTPDSSYIEPVVAQMGDGHILIGGLDISAIRGPQNSVFCLVTSVDYSSPTPQRFISGGIGCYGFQDTIHTVLSQLGRASEQNDDWVSGWSSDEGNIITNLKTQETIRHKFQAEYCGCLPSTLDAYFAWLQSMDDEEVNTWVSKIQQNPIERFNQGDLYFQRKVGIDLPVSEPGSAEAPVIFTGIKKS